MSNKTNPNALRFGVNKNWVSRWVAVDPEQEAKWIVEDDKVRALLIKGTWIKKVDDRIGYNASAIVRVEIERNQTELNVFVYCGQPGKLLGNDNANLPAIVKEINKIVGRSIKVNLNVLAYENTAWSARVIAREIADAIENRVPFRTAQKNAIKKVMMSKAKGVKTSVSGRLGGVEMARKEGYSEGIITLQTLRADIDFAHETAQTTMGAIGCKVWINRGEIFVKGLNGQITPPKPTLDTRTFGARRPFNKDFKKGAK